MDKSQSPDHPASVVRTILSISALSVYCLVILHNRHFIMTISLLTASTGWSNGSFARPLPVLSQSPNKTLLSWQHFIPPGHNEYTKKMFSKAKPNDSSVLYGLPMVRIWQRSKQGTVMDYLPDYKNPCWFEERSVYGLRCLPYVYLLGVAKSGTTSLFHVLRSHPDVAMPNAKEMFWWHKIKTRYSFPKYISYFNRAARIIYNDTTEFNGTVNYHQKITVDATPSNFCAYGDLEQIPGNKKGTEPLYTLADTLYRLNPATRLLVILRNPTDRLFSHYHHSSGRSPEYSADDFHHRCVAAIHVMRGCLGERSLRNCVLNHTLNEGIQQQHRVTLYYSMYYPFAADWLRVFPRHQMLFLKAEEFYKNPELYSREVYTFLDLSTLDPPKSSNRSHMRFGSRDHDYRQDIKPETVKMLDDFFEPFNKMLAGLLNDDRFLFLRD